ncbi:hybrid sensor histidine kinase/response regulator [Chitinispirillales bacterium ANBcel5]|uniref:ATP-binding response regulator n=1 Tax=Cellulosispirillum alkaliphilum TaxID=3039283 RepID=UPI002A551115|nr:hybrid sensor histidine kinase/response regulator [Chitinispirillales bacterium ANBcel5]
MQTPIKILYLQANSSDTIRIEDLLSKVSPGFELLAISNKADFVEKSAKGLHDLIIIDFQHPQISATNEIEVIKERLPGVPVVILSDPIGEERAIECIKAGAYDFVLKENLSRLSNTVEKLFGEEKRAGGRINDCREEIAEKNRELKNVDSLKNEFIYRVTHEMRTPITAIRGFTDTLLSEDIPITSEENKEFLQIISKESHRLSRIVNRLQTIAKMQQGTLNIKTKPIELSEVLSESVNETVAPKGVVLEIESTETANINADKNLMKVALDTILDHAVRHTSPTGRVVATLEVSEDSSAHLSIRDSGPGIMPDQLHKVFDIFYSVETQSQKKKEGIGLSVAKSIIEHHGGTIWAHSTPGEGTTIHVTLPLYQ